MHCGGEVLVSRLGAAVADDDFKGVTTVFGQCLSLKFPRIIDRHPLPQAVVCFSAKQGEKAYARWAIS
jgi:hypothetical protein